MIAPQGSNVFVGSMDEREGHIPHRACWRTWVSISMRCGMRPLPEPIGLLSSDRTNFVYYYPPANSDSLGFFFDSEDGYRLAKNPWASGFENAPIDEVTAQRTHAVAIRYRDSKGCRQAGPVARFHDVSAVSAASPRLFRSTLPVGQSVHRHGGKAFNGEICSAAALRFNRYPGLVNRPFLGLDETFAQADSGDIRINGLSGGQTRLWRGTLRVVWFPVCCRETRRPTT